ncbi:hypothetical protein CDL15_Pgr001618 [Punica granatum]|uniref:PORR domain-containing protein n=1 Tax=Punica granatum TaxID=22663 RepID=A0A218XAT3_PUNGR|nr:hypothetical protein CDL15_Pgr001618 [Punica granatum]PKI44804.1 hypothetical protein CRG98_034752 [Punica granatum]
MSASKSLPLSAIFKVWRELSLPDDFEDFVISPNSHIFQLSDAHEPNAHILKLVDSSEVLETNHFETAVEKSRAAKCCREDSDIDRTEIQLSFKHGFSAGNEAEQGLHGQGEEMAEVAICGALRGDGGEEKV